MVGTILYRRHSTRIQIPGGRDHWGLFLEATYINMMTNVNMSYSINKFSIIEVKWNNTLRLKKKL